MDTTLAPGMSRTNLKSVLCGVTCPRKTGPFKRREHRQQGIEAARPQRPFRQDGRADQHLLVILCGRAITHRRAAHIERSDPGLEPIAMPHDPLTTVRQNLFGILLDEGARLCPQRGRQHTARAVMGDLGERIIHRSRLTRAMMSVSFVKGA